MRDVSAQILTRDWLTMILMTLFLLIFAVGFRGEGRVNRLEGAILLVSYVA